MTRDEHLAWAKDRALEHADAGDKGQCIASLMSDLGKWEGGRLYDPDLLIMLNQDAVGFRNTPADLRNWVEGFT